MNRKEKAWGRRIKLPFSSIRTTMLAVFSVLIVATITFFYIISLANHTTNHSAYECLYWCSFDICKYISCFHDFTYLS